MSQQRLEAFVGDERIADGHVLQPCSRGVPEQVDNGIHVRIGVVVVGEESKGKVISHWSEIKEQRTSHLLQIL